MGKQTKRDLYQQTTDAILQIMESGKPLPWRQPWKTPRAFGSNMPHNATSGRPYHGMNVPLLWAVQQVAGYETPQWITYRGAMKAGGHVRKGERSTVVYFWHFISVRQDPDATETERAQNRMVPVLRCYPVFNVAQCEGLDLKGAGEPKAPQWESVDGAERFVANLPVSTTFQGGRAFYTPALDSITMPPRESFRDAEGFYATWLHEHTHSTGHADRCNRQFGKSFGSQAYAFEELVAEMGSAFLCAEMGINSNLENHASYVDNWIQICRDNKRAFVKACGLAQRAAEFMKECQPDYVKPAPEEKPEENAA